MKNGDFFERMAVLAALGNQETADRAAYEALRGGSAVNYVNRRAAMKKLEVRISGELPEDEFDRAEVLSKLRGPISEFRAALSQAGFSHVHEVKVFTAKGKAAPKPRVVKPAAA